MAESTSALPCCSSIIGPFLLKAGTCLSVSTSVAIADEAGSKMYLNAENTPDGIGTGFLGGLEEGLSVVKVALDQGDAR